VAPRRKQPGQVRGDVARQTPEVGITRRRLKKREYIRRPDGGWENASDQTRSRATPTSVPSVPCGATGSSRRPGDDTST